MYFYNTELVHDHNMQTAQHVIGECMSAAVRKLLLHCCTKEEVLAAYDAGLSRFMDALPRQSPEYCDAIAVEALENTTGTALGQRMYDILKFLAKHIGNNLISLSSDVFVDKLLFPVMDIVQLIARLSGDIQCTLKYTAPLDNKRTDDKPAKYMSLEEVGPKQVQRPVKEILTEMKKNDDDKSAKYMTLAEMASAADESSSDDKPATDAILAQIKTVEQKIADESSSEE